MRRENTCHHKKKNKKNAHCSTFISPTALTSHWSLNIHQLVTTLKLLTVSMNNIDPLATVQYCAVKPWILTFMWMPSDTRTSRQNALASKSPSGTFSRTWAWGVHLVSQCSRSKSDWETWNVLIHGYHCMSAVGRTWLGWILPVKDHPHDYQGTGFSTRTLYCSYDLCHSLNLSVVLWLCFSLPESSHTDALCWWPKVSI